MRAALPIAFLCLVAGCGSAHENASGGDAIFDAAAPPSFSAPEDAGTGSTWTDLYADYFGPNGVAGCSGTGSCHGDSSQPGAQLSAFVCGATQDTCFTGITSQAAALITPLTAGDESTSLLEITLRKTTGGGTMPKTPAYAFTPADMARITAWLAAGAQNN